VYNKISSVSYPLILLYAAARFKLMNYLNLTSDDIPRIYAISGGHGSVFLTNALRRTGRSVHVRPDVAFDLETILDAFPPARAIKEFYNRTGYTLDASKTINDNVVLYLKHISESGKIVLIARLSRVGPFFTRNKINNVICVVRHPLHAYVSFVGHKHPEAGQEFGTLDSERRIEWYARQWNLLVADYINSGNKIIRFEFMRDDLTSLPHPGLSKLLKHWRGGIRNHSVLSKEKETFLQNSVAENFYKIYPDWDI
jgi:hypothetical protein